jgi:organic hydroperoxide reductase OsmC/OhrA
MQVGEHQRITAIANEDLDRTAPDKTASVHFMRFELTPAMLADAKKGARLTAGIAHPACIISREISDNVRAELVGDLS